MLTESQMMRKSQSYSDLRTFTSEGKASVKGFGQEGTERNKRTVASTVGNKVRKIGRHFIRPW